MFESVANFFSGDQESGGNPKAEIEKALAGHPDVTGAYRLTVTDGTPSALNERLPQYEAVAKELGYDVVTHTSPYDTNTGTASATVILSREH